MSTKTIGLRLQIDGVNQTITTVKELETAIGKMREKLATVAIGSQDFKRLTSEIQRAETEVGKLRQQTEGIGFEKQLEGFGKFTGGITSGFAAATAAAQLFGDNAEEVSKAAATAQNLLTVAIGARGIAETIAGAKIVATTIATKAQTIATNIANLSLKSLYTTMVANPIGAVLAVVGALVTAMIALSDSTKKQITVQDQINKAMTVSATKTAEQTTKLNALLSVVNDTTKSEQARNGALTELKKLLPGINTLTLKNANANDILSKSVDNYVKKQEKLIQLEQIRDLLKEKGQKLDELNNKSLEDEITLTDRLINFNNPWGAAIRANTRLTEERDKAQKEYNATLSQFSELVRQTTEEEVQANQVEADRLKAIEDAKKAYDASIANQRRRNELIKSELQKNLANLELAYREEVKAAREKGEDVSLVEQVFLKNRAKLFEDYKKEFIRIQTETYTELNRLTTGSYLVEEAELKRTQKVQREELEKFYDDLLAIAEKERTKSNAAVTAQSKEVVAAKQKEFDALNELTKKRALLESIAEQGETQAMRDKAQRDLDILKNNYDEATKARIAAEQKFTQVQKQQAGVNTKQIEEEKERIRKEFRETQAQQELLFEAQLNVQRKQVILDGKKAINDILNMEDEDRLNFSKEIFNEEFDLFKDAEKRKIRAAIESRAIIQKNGQEFTQEEKDDLEELVQLYFKNYDAIAENVRQNKLKEIEYSKQAIAFDKQSLNQRLESEQTFTEQLLALKSELSGEESVKKREKIQKKIELLEAKHAQELLKIEAENLIKKLEILQKDPTLNEEEQKRIQLAILDLRKQYADKQIAIDKLVTELGKEEFDFFFKELSKGQADALAKLGFAVESFSRLLSGFASTTAQSFQTQIEALELLNTETLSRIAEEGARIQGESEADYLIRKERTDQKREEQEKIFAANKKKIEKEARLSSLKFQIAQTIADTASATIKTFAQFGFSPAAYVANAIGAIIAVAQIAEISKQIGVVQSMARGGFLRGPSHEQGGIRYQGGGVELEGNEAVINRRSTLQYAPLLSQINQQGGGKPIYVNSIMDSRMAEVLASTRNEPIRAYVLEQDITKSQAVNRRLEELASF